MHAPIRLTLHTEWRPLATLEPLASEWRSLAARAIEPNVFYGPDFALAAAPVLGADAGAVLVWSSAGRLLGFFPARIERRHGPFARTLTGWVNAFGPLGLPLVDSAEAEKVIAAWLDHLAKDTGAPAVLLMPLLPQEGPFSEAFARVVAMRGLQIVHFDRHARAILEPGEHREDYVERSVPAKTRKELARKQRRLAELGELTHETAKTLDEVTKVLPEFFALEASGWKGRVGTAAAQDAGVRGFVEKAIDDLASEGKVRIDIVRLDGKPVAATLVLTSGDTAWGWKIAYDESRARYSPAVQLILELTHILLKDRGIRRIDSSATPDHPMIDHFWRERLTLSDCMIALRPGSSLWLASRLEAARRGVIAVAKRLRDGWRARKIRRARAASAE